VPGEELRSIAVQPWVSHSDPAKEYGSACRCPGRHWPGDAAASVTASLEPLMQHDRWQHAAGNASPAHPFTSASSTPSPHWHSDDWGALRPHCFGRHWLHLATPLGCALHQEEEGCCCWPRPCCGKLVIAAEFGHLQRVP